jgi:sigma-E factor negative regulatory protein RseC
MSKLITHTGKIVAIKEKTIAVEIVNISSCAGCRAKTFCSLSNQGEKLIEVPLHIGQPWEMGEEVEISLHSSLGFKAVFIIYVLPLLALLSVLFLMLFLGVSELITGLSALIAPLLCYFVVWLLRSQIEKEYIFAIEKKNFRNL